MKELHTNKRNSREVVEHAQDAAVQRSEHRMEDDGTMRLDDSQRVKVLSPGMLVFKRFIRNKLAIVGVCILITMFVFSFLCPLFYRYEQTTVFYKFDNINASYGGVTIRQDFVNYTVDESIQVSDSAKLMLNSEIKKLADSEDTEAVIHYDSTYILEELGEYVYTLSAASYEPVASFIPPSVVGSYNTMKKEMTYAGNAMDADFEAKVAEAAAANGGTFTYDGKEYSLTSSKKFTFEVKCETSGIVYAGEKLGTEFESAMMTAMENGEDTVLFEDVEYQLVANAAGGVDASLVSGQKLALVSSVLVFDTVSGVTLSDAVKIEAMRNTYNGESFQVEGVTYAVTENELGEMTLEKDGEMVARMTNVAIRDSQGQDSLSIEFKRAAEAAVAEMNGETKVDQHTFNFLLQKMEVTTDESGKTITSKMVDENGDPVMEDTTLTLTRKTGEYEITCPQLRYLIDISGAPTKDHWLGTDANGMDNLARMMYGGRISLMVGFIVVFLEIILGVIMGGIAGYFGGWVDTLIMRLVDIFRCIPSMPILIIMASFMEAQQVDTYVRLMYMMAILGFLGWAGIARMVRGQILSLREQEFMTATEATGIKVRHRIFRHLVPNVMPQLIVTATSGLGGVILTESTLSYLGLGVKFPMATWGNIINTVTKTNENLVRYTYIWIPVGLLICLTVVAFNFVGDGLRDAFDPKMKR